MSLSLIEEKKSRWDLKYDYGKYRVHDKELPERVVAYDENFIRELYNRHKLDIADPVHYGAWSGRQEFLSAQDIIVAIKSQN